MLCFKRRHFLALGAVALLGGCGFKPVYGPSGQADGLYGGITMVAPEDQNSYYFVRQAEARLGRNLAAPYRLSYEFTIKEQEVGLTSQQEITRHQVFGEVEFTVRKTDSDTEVFNAIVSDFTSYSTEGSTVSTASVERDAFRRLMVILADHMVTSLMANYPDFAP